MHLIRSAFLIGLAHECRPEGTDLRQPIGHPDEDSGGRVGLERTRVSGPQRWRSVRTSARTTDLTRCPLKVRDFLKKKERKTSWVLLLLWTFRLSCIYLKQSLAGTLSYECLKAFFYTPRERIKTIFAWECARNASSSSTSSPDTI